VATGLAGRTAGGEDSLMMPESHPPVHPVPAPPVHHRLTGWIRGRRARLQSLAVVVVLCAAACGDPPSDDPDAVWSEGRPYTLAEVAIRQDDWARAAAAADSLPDALWERARRAVAAFDGGVRLLAVSEDGCIDSAHSIPYLDALASGTPGMALRLVDRATGRELLDAHPAPDGRAATPTVLILDDEGTVQGCWIERPAPLQSWYLANPDGLGRTELYAAKTAWYEADGGAHVAAEFVELLEAAAAGTPACGLPLDPDPRLPAPGVLPGASP
jgi:hypothetical protein